MCVWVASRKALASTRCCASDGRATIAARAFALALPPAAVAEAGAGAGVAAATRTGGGAVGALVRPTVPVSTAISTASPSAPIEQASSQAPRSDGGAGGDANPGADTTSHPNQPPRRSCRCPVRTHMRTPTLLLLTLAVSICFAGSALVTPPVQAATPSP